MTREEALKIMKLFRNIPTSDKDSDVNQALDMAIKALEQEPTTKNDLDVDCISRKAVFETIDDCNSDGLKGIFCSYDDGERFKEYIKNLPPVILQEPKPMVEIDLYSVIKQKYIEREALDKIRAEIASLSNANPSYWHSGDMVEREEVLDIIDKYRAETEAE